MSWDRFPEELQALGEPLASVPETEQTAEDLNAMLGRFRATWHQGRRMVTSGSGIRIPPPRSQGLHPRNCQPEGAKLAFDFFLGDPKDGIPDKADFQVMVFGALEVRNGMVHLEDHWRVDTDGYAGAAAHREPHPLFHFQRGGHAQDAFASGVYFVPGDELPVCADLWRGLMQSSSPRLPMLPMCPVLMIDFTIAQHNGVVWKALRSRSDYALAVSRAQERLWQPLLEQLSRDAVRRRWLGAIWH